MIRLSPRLSAAAALAGTGDSVIDVGTDHGYLPVRFVQSGAFARVAASDISAGPLWTARCSARERGVEERIEFYLSDGLQSVPGRFDTVVIAGMGGETMRDIIAGCPWALSARFILQPQTRAEELSAYLDGAGFVCAGARLCRDAGRLYAVFEAKAGIGGFDPAGALLASRDPLLGECVARETERVRKALAGMERGVGAQEADLRALRDKLSRLERLEKETGSWQG